MNTTDHNLDPDDVTLAPDVRAKILAEEYAGLAEHADHIKARQDTIKQLLADLLPSGGAVGDYKVTVTRPRRLDAKAIEAAFPVTQYPHLYAPKPDTTAVRKHIAEVDLEPYMVEGAPVVKVS